VPRAVTRVATANLSHFSFASYSPERYSLAMKPSIPAEAVETAKVAKRLSELCNSGQNHIAMQELYADNVRHVEAMGMDDGMYARLTEGKSSVMAKAEAWLKSTQIHSASCSKPLVNGDQFVCQMSLDATATAGPMAGQRMQMNETALYTVKNGKIVEAKFFYPGCEQ